LGVLVDFVYIIIWADIAAIGVSVHRREE
jgi:hypothetical protein